MLNSVYVTAKTAGFFAISDGQRSGGTRVGPVGYGEEVSKWGSQ
jgi:hypothetical protein